MINVRTLKSVEDFHTFRDSNDGNLRIVKLSAPWCAPCKFLGETIKNLDKDRIGSAMFADIDIDTDETADVGTECGVRGVPVLIYFKNGKEVSRSVGAVPADKIYDEINKLS